jgi:hypothetical protein
MTTPDANSILSIYIIFKHLPFQRKVNICNACDVFEHKFSLEYDCKSVYQALVNAQLPSGEVKEIKRERDGKFKSACGKSFKLPLSLCSHTNNCHGLIGTTEDDVTPMEEV